MIRTVPASQFKPFNITKTSRIIHITYRFKQKKASGDQKLFRATG